MKLPSAVSQFVETVSTLFSKDLEGIINHIRFLERYANSGLIRLETEFDHLNTFLLRLLVN